MKGLIFLTLAAGALAQEGNLIIHKQIKATNDAGVFSTDKNFTVSIDVYNVGDGSAYEVSVTDNWPESTSSGTDAFKLDPSSSYSANWPEITAGGHVSYNITIMPIFEGRFEGSRAQGSYQPTLDGDAKMVLSTSSAPMSVLAADQYAKYFAKHNQEWGIFYIGALSTILIPLFVYGSIQVSYKDGIPTKKLQ